MTLKFAKLNKVCPSYHANFWARLLFISCLSLEAGFSHAQLPAPVEKALNEAKIKPETVALSVQEINGDILFEHNATTPMRAASVMKLLTTFAALERLGPNWTWKTEAYAQGEIKDGRLEGALLLKGYGDPSLTIERLWLLAQQLKKNGLREINDGLIIDLSYLDQPTIDFKKPLDAPWEIIPSALMINLQATRLFFERRENSVRVRAEPDLGWQFKLDLPIVDAPCREDVEDEWQPQMDWSNPPTAYIQGKFPSGCDTRVLNIGVTNPTYYIGALFKNIWQEQGGTISGPVRLGTLNTTQPPFAQIESNPLSKAIVDMNKFSSNPMARAIYLSIGKAYPLTELSNADSADIEIKRWLAEKKLDFPELVQETGSGLSRREQLSAQHWTQLLTSAAQSRYAAEFTASLPILGVDGTMRKRLKGEPAMGWGHFKTGTLSDTKSLAGYLTTASGKRLALAILINTPNLGRRADLVFEQLLRTLFNDMPSSTTTQ